MKNIYILIFPTAHLLDLSGPLQVFYEANDVGKKKFKLHYVGLEKTVQSAQLLWLTKLELLHSIHLRPSDLLIIPGIDFEGFRAGVIDTAIQQASPIIIEHWKNGGTIMSICSGSLILAKTGLLNNKKCSTHWKCFDYLKSTYPRITLEEQNLFSSDGNIYSSAGMTTGIDMALAYIEQLYDPLLAAHIAREMVINVRRENIGEQKNTFLNFKNKFHPVVYQVQQILKNRVDHMVTVESLAEELNMSSRNLNRLFRQHTGDTIVSYRNQVKMREAERLLRYSHQSIKEIAFALGYASEPYFIRVWKSKYEISPGKFRSQLKTIAQ